MRDGFIRTVLELAKNDKNVELVTGDLLGVSYHTEMKFENPDGTPYRLDKDILGNARPEKNVTPGPFELACDGVIEFNL